MWDQKTGRSRGFGFVSFRSQQDAQNAINDLNGKWLGSRQIRCNWATKGASAGEEKQNVDYKADLTNSSSEAGKENASEESPQNNPQFTTVYVGNLPHEANSSDVHRFFHSLGAGSIEEVRVTRDKGFGFVRYSTHDEAALAIHMGNGQLIGGRQIKCSWGSKPTPPETASAPLPPPAPAQFPTRMSAADLRAYQHNLFLRKMAIANPVLMGQHALELGNYDGVTRKAAEIHPNRPTRQIEMEKAAWRTVYPHLLAQYMKQTKLIGIDDAIEDLVKILLEGNEVSKNQGKIVSIVGVAGLGKTSLANALYCKLRSQFDCCAFVSVGRNLDIKKLFNSMLYQLGKKHNSSIHNEIWDERLLIYELIELLQKKRYLIIIDGIWDISVWQIIRDALPDNRCGYRIITTTLEINIGEQIGGAYKLKPLDPQNSKVLLYRRIFGNEYEYAPDKQLVEVCDKILTVCNGIPLAVIVIAGMLASKKRNKVEWFNVYNSIVTAIENNPDVIMMELILSLSYADLPSHLKNCLSYISVLPEGYEIEKGRLIKLWRAEGFIQHKNQEESLFELGENYFYELIIRGMIQPVCKRWYYDITEYCRVHDKMLDLCYLSSKEKYVSILNYMHLTPSEEVRWLSFQNSMVNHATHRPTVGMQQVTSIVVFPSAINLLPSLQSFRDLRVLDLQNCHLSQGCSLQYLGNLFDLRYLGLRDTGISQLMEEIGNLQSLQTLDVTGNEISSLPPTVVQLRHLICLSIDSWTRVPNGIRSLTSLEELSTLCIDDSSDIIEELGQLTELRVLGIELHTAWNADSLEKSLVEFLNKLQKVRTLSLSVFGKCKLESWLPPKHVCRLELKGCLSPPLWTWMNSALLLNLSSLSMETRKLWQEDLKILGCLPALIYLDLDVDRQSHGNVQRLVIGDGSFLCLLQCMLRGYIGPVVFEQGAMPRLARLHLSLPVQEMRETTNINGGFDLGLGNLRSLQDISFLVRRGGAIKAAVEEAEAALRHAVEIHPKRPIFEIYVNDSEDE